MFIYAYRQYSAAQTGSAFKQVRCEKCGSDFTYEAIRRTLGFGHSPYGLRNKAALAEARGQANQKLVKKLKKAVDAVPCPKCGWFQQHMVKELRRRDQRWMLWTGWVGAALAWASAVMGLLTATQAFSQPIEANQGTLVFGLIAAGVAWAMVWLGGRKLVGARINPNRDYTGTPVASSAQAAPIQKGFAFDPALLQATASGSALDYERHLPGANPGGWVTVQLARFQCPNRCCSCMAETHEHKKFNCGNLASVSVPLCRQCARRFMWKHGLVQVKAAGIGVFLALGAAIFTPKTVGAEIVVYAAYGLAGLLVGALAGVPIANRVARPVELSGFQSELNTIRLRFANGNYLRSFPETKLV